MNNNFLFHFLEMHGLTEHFIQEEELYLQDKICAYAYEDTRNTLVVGTWQECENARAWHQYNGFIIREATQSEKDFYDTKPI